MNLVNWSMVSLNIFNLAYANLSQFSTKPVDIDFELRFLESEVSSGPARRVENVPVCGCILRSRNGRITRKTVSLHSTVQALKSKLSASLIAFRREFPMCSTDIGILGSMLISSI